MFIYEMVGVELFLFSRFYVTGHETPLMFCLWGEREGGDVAYMCMTHSLMELMMGCLMFLVLCPIFSISPIICIVSNSPPPSKVEGSCNSLPFHKVVL